MPKKRLRFVDVISELPNGDADAAKELSLHGRGYTEVESLESCRSLRKLELKENYLSDMGFLDMNHELCWLGVAKNRLERISGLTNLTSLAVLDLSDNRIARLDGLSGLCGLKALIVARNRISRVEGLSPKRNPLLETLVFSHNLISECNLAPFPALKKLSLAQNKLHAFPGLATLPNLVELRLNGNRITSLSSAVAKQPRLSILDIGNNLFEKADSLEPLRGLLWMKSINLLGNAVSSDLESQPMQGLLSSLQRLEIVNNRRLPDAERANKKGRRSRRNGAKGSAVESAVVEAKPVAVHGRDFKGKRSVFKDDSDAEGDNVPSAKRAAASGASRHKDEEVEVRRKKNAKKVGELAKNHSMNGEDAKVRKCKRKRLPQDTEQTSGEKPRVVKRRRRAAEVRDGSELEVQIAAKQKPRKVKKRHLASEAIIHCSPLPDWSRPVNRLVHR
jgi:hypothetical protein